MNWRKPFVVAVILLIGLKALNEVHYEMLLSQGRKKLALLHHPFLSLQDKITLWLSLPLEYDNK